MGLWGYSGGGVASAWAAEVTGGYAPELNMVGAVLGSPVGDLGQRASASTAASCSALPALMIAALTNVYPDRERVVESMPPKREGRCSRGSGG